MPLPAASSTGNAAATPDFARRFNWGAFLLTWIWALGNRCFDIVTLILLVLSFVPTVGAIFALALAFYSGLTGSRRAWATNRWNAEQAFVASQRKWALAAFWTIGALVALSAVALILGER